MNVGVSHNEESAVRSFAVEGPNPLKDKEVEKDGEEQGKKDDKENEAQDPLSDWEAALAAAESGDLPEMRFLVLNRLSLHISSCIVSE